MFSMRTRYIAVKAAIRYKKTEFLRNPSFLMQIICDYLPASSTATATATVAPTIGLLAAPDNRRRASLQARLQASRGRLLHERCV